MKRILISALSLVFVQIAAAQGYKVIDLGPLIPAGINAEGEVAGNVNGQAYVWTEAGGLQDLGLMSGGTFSEAVGINDRGMVAGTADGPGIQSGGSFGDTSCDDMIQPFTWTREDGLAAPASIPEVTPGLQQVFPCAQANYAFGLNNRGLVVGSNASFATYKLGFLWDRENGVSIIIPSYQSAAAAISNRGVVAGRVSDSSLDSQSAAVIFRDGATTELGSLVSPANQILSCSAATGLNDRDQAVGWSTTIASPDGEPCQDMFSSTVPVHAFLWDADRGMTDLGTLPGDSLSVALKVNLFGVVIGESGNSLIELMPPAGDEFTPEVEGRPFMWSRFTGMRNLNDFVDPHSGWVLTTATDINVWGQVVGTGMYDGESRGYLLTPRILFQH